MDRDWFIKRYTNIHEELNALEKEIESHLKNKKEILCDENKLILLKNRILEKVNELNKTREDERRIFNY